MILEHPDAHIHKFAEDHGFLDLSQCAKKPLVGDIACVIPNHVCVAANMVNQSVAVRDGKIINTIPIEARGMLVWLKLKVLLKLIFFRFHNEIAFIHRDFWLNSKALP